MEIPLEAYSAPITDFQFRLLATICRLSGSGGRLKASIAEICNQMNNPSDRTVRRGVQALSEANLLQVIHGRKAGGHQDVSTYVVSSNDRLQPVTNVSLQTVTNDRTTGDYVSGGTNSQQSLVPNNQDSYKLKDLETVGFKKEIRVPMKRYEDDGDDLAGFGLIEPKDAPQKKISKADPRTRGKRPEHEWTAMDVAAEFSYRVGKKYPLLPGTVSVKQLAGALSKFRKQYNTTPLIELELLRLFMADDTNFRNIGDEAPLLYKVYLSSFGKKMNQARENLGLAKVTSKVETTESAATLVASDGRVFQNSLSGRKQLERHEARLKETANG